MTSSLDRRELLKRSVGCAVGVGLATAGETLFAADKPPLYKISLAEWSLHRKLRAKGADRLDHLDFPKVTKELGIDGVEYVNQFFKDKVRSRTYLSGMKQRCADLGVVSLLIMCDGEGALGDPDAAKRTRAVKNHHKWVEAAKLLGCHSIRVNAASRGTPEEQAKLAADGLRRLTAFGAEHEINVIVENHGGLSSNGKWLAGVIKAVGHPRCGTLPDFGNFRVSQKPEKWYDRYKGVEELMPYAKAVSAKSQDFDAKGNETRTDYFRMMKIVLDAGYHGYVGIEYEGRRLSEIDGIKATRDLLIRVREKLLG